MPANVTPGWLRSGLIGDCQPCHGFTFLPSNNLTGTLPALTAFTDLANFDVSGNSLTGSIPALAGLTNLGAFAVSHNKLTGSISRVDGS